MTASLLEKESTGGAIARVGFEYQDAYVLEHIPEWLAQGAFSHLVSEAIGDLEVCYFNPNGGFLRRMYEAKNHTLTVTQFWDEVARFKAVFEASPREFPRFVLVCRDYNGNTNPIVSKIERLRGVGSSYESNSPILEAGRKELREWGQKNGDKADLAEFALDHVEFVTYTSESADQAFIGQLNEKLPGLDLPASLAVRLRDDYKGQIARSSSGPVYRKELEAALCDLRDAERQTWLSTPVQVQLLSGATPFHELGLDVGSFNGDARAAKTLADWLSLLAAAGRIAEFINGSTTRRVIALDGKQRMSTSCLLGYAFSATRGFLLHVEHNGISYRTAIHDRSPGTFFNEVLTAGDAQTSEGIVCIGFPTAVGADINLMSSGALAKLPRLTLESSRTIANTEELNLAVVESKNALVRFRSQNQISKLHVFIKAPSVFAMALGHRLNGVCAIQLNDWVDGRYQPTALLDS